MNKKIKIVVLHSYIPFNAPIDEQDNLVEANYVADILEKQGAKVSLLGISINNMGNVIECLKDINPDLVFNLVESIDGQGRFITWAPAVLDSLAIPYTGANTRAIFTTSNKLIAKDFLNFNKTNTPRFFTENDLKNGAVLEKKTRYIIKSVWEHASIGLGEHSVINTDDSKILLAKILELKANNRSSAKFYPGDDFFAEKFIDGREFNVSLLATKDKPDGFEVLPPAEIIFKNYPEDKLKIVDYKAKWNEDTFEYKNTQRNFSFSEDDNKLINNLKNISSKCWHAFNLKGYARVDFRVDTYGMPWVLEINTNPCISPDGGFLAAGSQIGLNSGDIISMIIADGINPT